MIKPSHPIPAFFDKRRLDSVYRTDYELLAKNAQEFAMEYSITPACEDKTKVGLLLVDVQNTFCIPGFELFVGGKSGRGAVEDNTRLCQFIYRHMGRISQIVLTMDTHMAMAVFHSAYLVDNKGHHPELFSQISVDDIEQGRWRFNEKLADTLGISAQKAQQNLVHYVKTLAHQGKYQLTIWPYHALLGGIGHAIVSSIEEAVFFHSQTRYSQPVFTVKGISPYTENYSALGPDVIDNADGEVIVPKNKAIVEQLLSFDVLIIAGQAKSHCVAWTVDDLLTEIQKRDASMAKKIYLLEDCTTPIVIPGGIDYTDYTDYANEAFDRFAKAGMHIIQSSDELLF